MRKIILLAVLVSSCSRPPDFTTPDGRCWKVDTVCACPGGFHLGSCVSTRLDTTQVRTPDGPINY